jgi:single-strand DNA-binding protein
MNKVILSGNLTRDPEVRYTPNGVAYARMGIAVTRPFSSKNNEGQPATDFFNLTAWNKTAEFCGRYLNRGSRVLVEGRIQNDNYEDKNGVKHYSVSITVENIEFAGAKRNGNDNNGGSYETDNSGGGSNYDNSDDVDVPF